ncbi:MAG: phosphatidylglycerol lysyltransferase domain-containing protein [bacterium]|nr:phosphatidylglycerol lysyltransferase domain-containing protein [bacterium]
MEPIPVFPNFREIKIDDRRLFDDYFRQIQPRISEYTFANLYTWRHIFDIKISLLYENIVIQLIDTHGHRIFTPFIGGIRLKEALDACLNYARSQWKEVRFGLFPEDQLQLFKLYYPTAPIAIDRDASDYIYNTNDLVMLKGKKYDGKRNHISRFKKNFEYTYQRLDSKHINGCKDLLEKWYHQHCDYWECSLSLRSEIEACKEALDSFKKLDLCGGIIDIDKQIVAFSIGEALNKDTFVVHFEKVDADYKELPAIINQEFAAHEAKDFKYINREEDLGELGLRASKMSYNPAFLIDKYYITF